MELNRERAQTTKFLTREFFTSSEVQDMIDAERENMTFHPNAPVVTGIMEEKLIDAPQVRYDATEEEVWTPLSILVVEAIFEIINHGKMEWRMIRETEALS